MHLARMVSTRYHACMDKKAILDALKVRIFMARRTVTEVCAEAGVDRSTLSRWATRPEAMQATTLRKLEQALDRIEAQR